MWTLMSTPTMTTGSATRGASFNSRPRVGLLERLWDRDCGHAARLCPGLASGRLGHQSGACGACRTGVEIGDVQDLGGVLYASFSDPDGNGWALQQLPY
jgi:hypothetical protein